jgi:hypothetical protein
MRKRYPKGEKSFLTTGTNMRHESERISLLDKRKVDKPFLV